MLLHSRALQLARRLRNVLRELLTFVDRLPWTWRYRPNPGSVVEPLESRLLLNGAGPDHVFAQFDGQIDAPGSTVLYEITLTAADFSLLRGSGRLGLLLTADGDSGLDPAAIEVRNSHGAAVAPLIRKHNLAGSRKKSLTVVDLPLGTYGLTVADDEGTMGAFALDVFLVGDGDGDGNVGMDDFNAARAAFGQDNAGPDYRVELDANMDSRITSADLVQLIRNFGVTTSVTPLSLSAEIESLDVPLDMPDITITGSTRPGLTVELDVDDDGSTDQMITADGVDGSFSFDLTLLRGLNVLDVSASDTFGQRPAQTIGVELSTGPLFPHTRNRWGRCGPYRGRG